MSDSPYFSIGFKRSQATDPETMEESLDTDRKRLLPSEGMSRNAMLENLHNVERRIDQPQKRLKPNTEDLKNGHKSSASYAHRGSGIVGDYMKPNPDTVNPNGPDIPQTVDLTNGMFSLCFQAVTALRLISA